MNCLRDPSDIELCSNHSTALCSCVCLYTTTFKQVFQARDTPHRRERARFWARGNIKTRRRHEKQSLRTASPRLRFKFNPLAASPPFETSVLVSTSPPPRSFTLLLLRERDVARVNLLPCITSDRISPTFSRHFPFKKFRRPCKLD